jgi:DNA-binding MarR family transcriptional regulator
VTLNINATPTETPGPDRRRRLADAVRDELLSWNPREFISAFRRWHHGSFSLIHLNVLTMLDEEGPDSMSHLAEALDVSVASMTGIVDRMEKRRLVERRHEGKDRRVVLVYPTEAGRDVFGEIDQRRRMGLGKLLERLSAEELEGLLKGHRALRHARTATTAARAAEASGTVTPDSPTPTAPPPVHPSSTISADDPSVKHETGGGR